MLEHGKPLVFGKNRDQGIRMNGLRPEVVSLGDVPAEADPGPRRADPVLAFLLAHMTPPEFPTPIGVLYAAQRPVYEEAVQEQLRLARQRHGNGDLAQLFAAGDVWTVP